MRKPVGKRLLPPATVGALPLDSTANKARGAAWRSRWSEGLGATGERCRQSTGRTQSREMRWGQEPASGPPVSQEPARHGSSRGVPSQPERGAGCVSAHVRIWAGPVG